MMDELSALLIEHRADAAKWHTNGRSVLWMSYLDLPRMFGAWGVAAIYGIPLCDDPSLPENVIELRNQEGEVLGKVERVLSAEQKERAPLFRKEAPL
jgi:hypothetical protein